MSKSLRAWLWTATKILLALGLAWTVFARTDWGAFWALRERIAWGWMLLASALFFFLIALKAAQYFLFLSHEVDYPHLLQIVVAQNAVANFIATGAGIASLLTLLKVERGVRWSYSSLAFLVTKWGDFFALWLALGATSAWLWPQIPSLHFVATLLLVFLGSVLGFLGLLLRWRGRLVRLMERLAARLHLDRWSWLARLLRSLGEVVVQEHLLGGAVVGRALAVSLFYLLVTMIWLYAGLRGLGLSLSPLVVIFVNVFLQLLSNVPIHAFGGLGVTEVTSLYLYGFFYPEQGELAAVLLGWRLWFYLLNIAALGYLPLLAFWKARKAQARSL